MAGYNSGGVSGTNAVGGLVVDSNSGTLSSNYGKADMSGDPWTANAASGKDGADANSGTGGYNGQGFYTGWDFPPTVNAPWAWSRSTTLGALPKLAWED